MRNRYSTVSYTHLDVYKRQAFKSAKEVVEAIDGDSNNYFDFTKSTELESNLKDYNSIITVSYTHLQS